MAAMEAANAHYTNGGHQQQPGLPASPTLTNPDMILPDYDRSDSPDPDLGPSAEQALLMWKNSQAANLTPDMHHMFVATGLAAPRPYGPAGPITPTTPIIYGNGTMLSDIGEVTEVESVVEKPSPPPPKPSLRRPSSPMLRGEADSARGSSPTIGAVPAARKRSKSGLAAKHERRLSMESTSTITMENSGVTAVPDIDDSVSVGDSVFQGDDEQSMASSYVEGTPAVEPGRLGVPKTDNFDRLSIYSATSLSRRAEEILANAKRRLTTMEGNLSRARSNLHCTTPMYASDDASTPSPPFQRQTGAAYGARNSIGSNGSTVEHNPGHARMSSDLGMRNGLLCLAPTPRSQSALGAAGGYRQPLTYSKSVDYLRGDVPGSARSSLYGGSSVRDSNVKPLTEDEVARLGEADSETQNARLEAFLSPTFQEDTPRNSLRSPSAAQMRDIKEQMKDLKGKISSLREQALRDSLKRRSLQSLRTPSPFTYAQVDQWYGEASRRPSAMAGQLPERNPWNGEEESVDGDVQDAVRALNGHVGDEETDYADAEEGVLSDQVPSQPVEPDVQLPEPAIEDAPGMEDDVSDMQTENGDVEEDQDRDVINDADDAGYVSESGESVYHDSVPHQISHEDREDAFDYEHFFLHSALGTMSLSRRRSTESLTSTGSDETTRGPLTTTTTVGGYTVVQPRVPTRRNSSNSISTIDTFATAQEARSLKSPVGDEASHDASSRAASAQSRHRSNASVSKRLSYTSLHPGRDNSDGSITPIAEESSTAGSPARPGQHHAANAPTALPSSSSSRRASVIHRPLSASLHRPSVSSPDSAGTNRCFPLVAKPASRPATVAGTAPTNRHAHSKKASTVGVLTPGASPEADMHAVASQLMSDMGREVRKLQRRQGGEGDGTEGETERGEEEEDEEAPHPLEALLREDKYLVERLVASLGKCVVGLTENGRAGSESRMYRRRLDAARRVLEGLDAPQA
ncbi:hypothetical protein VTJ83DRAFT_1961 [Remersonia thermophila]|uniref:BAG domain-containing protein n=1 Tax=Remersonia thermophila TaxID=72144 RepID=A0ABR4DJP5_9PEZI